MIAKPYTRLNTIKGVMGLNGDDSLDGYITRQILVYSQLFDKKAGRSFYFEEEKEEKIGVGSNTRRLILENTPVEKIHEIKYKDEVIDEEKYFLEDKKAGFVAKKDSYWRKTSTSPAGTIRRKPPQDPEEIYTVKYSGGYITPSQAKTDPQATRTLPYDIEEAVIQGVVAGVTQKGVDAAVDSITVGDGRTSFEGGDGDNPRNVPQFFIEIANSYKKIGVY